MRYIKFRAVDEKDGKIYQVNHIDNLNNSDETSYWTNDIEGGYKFYSKKLEQYTGLKDFNGIEIYDGDILQDVDDSTIVVVVEYDEAFGEYDCGDNNLYECTRDCVVIGNIHENADLLEETT